MFDGTGPPATMPSASVLVRKYPHGIRSQPMIEV